MPLRIFVVVATVGRAEITRRTVDLLADQTRLPDGVIIVGAAASDVAGVETARSRPEIFLSERGLCKQRNRSLDVLAGRADIIVFFDDDFVPRKDFIANLETLFESRPELAGATGSLIADGINGPGFSVEEAVDMVSADTVSDSTEHPRVALYGCNMIIRVQAAADLRFDERLPMYGWQEDVDFTYQLGKRGPLIDSSRLRGVHMGAKGGRAPGRKLGYSQIANPLYLLRKGTIPLGLAFNLMSRNLSANLLGSLRRGGPIDRRGRASGNLAAIWDVLRGRLDPLRMLDV